MHQLTTHLDFKATFVRLIVNAYLQRCSNSRAVPREMTG